MTGRTIGVVVNPIAGMGGKVGLKGTDGRATLLRAIEAGARPEAPRRAATALAAFVPAADEIRFLTYRGAMGEDSFAGLPLDVDVVGEPLGATTTAADTERAAAELRARGPDLLLFVGGDGTARDICRSVGESLVALGVPAGVKMHSAVFATSPRAATELALHYVQGGRAVTREAEVMDINEDDYRQGILDARLYGYLRIPFERRLVQGMKTSSPASEEMQVADIARSFAEGMDDDIIYVLGPGTTTRAIAAACGLPKTLIGVDVVRAKRMIARDVGEEELLDLTLGQLARIVVTVIGGQGYLFGRGNQQISARVIEQIGVDNIMVVATESKLVALRGRPLLVDTGDDALDRTLAGYMQVKTGPMREVCYRISP
jgi:predicted polyphosphate/ATP-dependent NAD kinase